MSERSAAEEAADGPEPTQSESRLKRPPSEERPTRVSVRPSAFGPPRPSSRPPAEPTSGEGPGVEEPEATSPSSARPAEAAAAPALDTASERPAPRQAAQRPTVDELTRHDADPRDPMTNSQFATRLSLLNVPSSASSAAKSSERARRPLVSIALFGGMLALSAVPLLRYLKQSEEPALGKQPAGESAGESSKEAPGPEQASTGSAPSLPSEPVSAEEKQQAIMALVAEANRALELGDAPQAERLFGRVIALDEDNPRAAFGLSRIRLAQGNLSGAEGWIQLAIRKRPRRAAYHLHYAEILERLGNQQEAGEERRRALAAEADE